MTNFVYFRKCTLFCRSCFILTWIFVNLNGTTKTKTPNFIILYADDLGYADTSVQMMDSDPSTRHAFIKTPGLERLAEIGARFTAAYSPTPTCTGSRISIQHGQSSAKIQYRNVFDVLSQVQRPEGYDAEITIAEMLKESGKNYITAHFGKGCSAMGRFEDAGYDITDENPGEPGGNGNGHGSYWNPIKKKTPFPPDNPKRMHSLRKDAADFLKNNAGKQPFFMMVSHYAPHIPFMCTREAFERTKKRWIEAGLDTKGLDELTDDPIVNPKGEANKKITYAAMVEEMDLTLVDVLDALEQTGELQNTYIIFTSDNGGGYAENRKVDGGIRRFNGPLQEGKRSIFEGGIRVPTVISGPGIKAGSECDVPIVQWDFLPTFHDLSGSESPMPPNVDGGSLRQVFEKGNKGKVKRVAPGIIHHYTCHYHPPISSIIIGDYKLMRQLNSGEFLLFNLKTDYREEKNLAPSMPEKVKEMDEICRKYVKKVKGGTAEQVRQAHHKLMDHFGQQSIDGYRNKLADLKEQKLPDFDVQKAKMLKDLNAKLFKNLVNKEKTNLHRNLHAWREGTEKNVAEQNARAKWVEFTD
jgi:arylsulfatase A-like enzyme